MATHSGNASRGSSPRAGDWGAVVTDVMATMGDPALIGIHTNMPNAAPAEIDAAARAGQGS